MSIWDDLKSSYNKFDNSIRKLIFINAAVFILINLVLLVCWISQVDTGVVLRKLHWIELALGFPQFLYQPWTLFTYMFVHVDLFHVLFNMIFLFIFGNIFKDFVGNEKIWIVYVLGGITGGILTILAYNFIPAINESIMQPYMLGASAAVMAIVLAAATLTPDYSLFLIFIGPVRIKYIAFFYVVLDLIMLPGGNPGGHISHLGGALFGFLYITQMRKGRDLGAFMPVIGKWFTGLFRRKAKMKVAYRTTYMKTETKDNPSQAEIDRILDKISQSGYESLSKREREILFKASKDN